MQCKLVSVGVPTYNRPSELARALTGIVSQTYSNLEIVVSDNASPNPEVNRIIREFTARDKRIIHIRQPTNIGAHANFRAVLERASGDFFMWAADDDVRSPEAVSHYVENIGSHGGYFSSFIIRDYEGSTDKNGVVPLLTGHAGSKSDIRLFLSGLPL